MKEGKTEIAFLPLRDEKWKTELILNEGRNLLEGEKDLREQ